MNDHHLPVRYPAGDGHTVEVYPSPAGWRWWALAANGVIVAQSPQTYRRRDSALRAATRLLPRTTPTTAPPVEELT